MEMKYGPLEYWKLRAKFTEFQLNEERLRLATEANKAAMNKIFMDAGYDPNKNWIFDDNREMILEVNGNVSQFQRSSNS